MSDPIVDMIVRQRYGDDEAPPTPPEAPTPPEGSRAALVAWLQAKWCRHGELEDRLAAEMLTADGNARRQALEDAASDCRHIAQGYLQQEYEYGADGDASGARLMRAMADAAKACDRALRIRAMRDEQPTQVDPNA